jgi:hypothetical protein
VTEAEWLACDELDPMLDFLRRKADDRKIRLFGLACCRRDRSLSRANWSRALLTAAERYFDNPGGLPEGQELSRARRQLDHFDAEVMRPAVRSLAAATQRHGFAVSPLSLAAEAVRQAAQAARRQDRERAAQAALLRDVFGNPFRPTPTADPAWLAWNGGTVRRLAEAIYEGRALDRLPVLADALEDAGCTDWHIVSHCRSGGAHVRGCWVIDLLLGKE